MIERSLPVPRYRRPEEPPWRALRQHRLTFFVPGEPITEGSLKPQGRTRHGGVRLAHDDERLKPWRECIGLIAKMAGRGTLPRDPLPMDVPVWLGCVFVIQRPQRHSSRVTGKLWKHAPMEVCGEAGTARSLTGDLDKYVRAVGDALTLARILTDDSQITHFLEPIGLEWPNAEAWWGDKLGVHVALEW